MRRFVSAEEEIETKVGHLQNGAFIAHSRSFVSAGEEIEIVGALLILSSTQRLLQWLISNMQSSLTSPFFLA